VVSEIPTAKCLSAFSGFTRFYEAFKCNIHPFTRRRGTFVGMVTELCDGDVEGLLRKGSKEHTQLLFVKSLMLQIMCPLATANEKVQLRHNDIKLLNVLYIKPKDKERELLDRLRGGHLSWNVPRNLGRYLLNDFGNATIGKNNDGMKILAMHIGT
jgi:hypothetical protein